MSKVLSLKKKKSLVLVPKAPYNFDANFHKPSHFPSSDNVWEKGKYWITMFWQGQELGLRFDNQGTIAKPKIRVNIYSQKVLSKRFLNGLLPEIRWRFGFDTDISEFCKKFKKDRVLGPFVRKWQGMKPMAANSLYETLIIYIVLQNATVRRSVQMLENLFNKYGQKVGFDSKELSVFWPPSKIARSTEKTLRDLRVGYRAKFFMKLSQQFAKGEIDEFKLRKMAKEEIKKRNVKFVWYWPSFYRIPVF